MINYKEEELNKIMHITLPISNGSALMGSDVPNILGKVNEEENRSKITISAESKEEADQLFISTSMIPLKKPEPVVPLVPPTSKP